MGSEIYQSARNEDFLRRNEVVLNRPFCDKYIKCVCGMILM